MSLYTYISIPHLKVSLNTSFEGLCATATITILGMLLLPVAMSRVLQEA